MKPATDLFFLPPPPSFSEEGLPRAGITSLLSWNRRKIEEALAPSRSFLFQGERPDRLSRPAECAYEILPRPRPCEPGSARQTLFRCMEFVAATLKDHGQLCLFASPMLAVSAPRFLQILLRKAVGEGLPVTTVEAAEKHPCLMLRIEENPKDFPYNPNYRYHKLEIPGLLRMDERGEHIVCTKENKPLYRRQDYPPVFVTNHALTALSFSSLVDYPRLFFGGEVRAFAMDPSDAILCRDELTLFLALRDQRLAEARELLPTGSEGRTGAAWAAV
jgi:hypothetical protein